MVQINAFEAKEEWKRVSKSIPAPAPPVAGILENILIIDEDAILTQNLINFLSERECRVRAVRKLDNPLSLVRRNHWGLILLDMASCREDGLTRLRTIRSLSDVPIIITGERLTSTERIIALELGADGHIEKPFDPHEFWAHARAIGRRQALGQQVERGAFRFDGWMLTLSDRSLLDPAGRRVRLGRCSYALLVAFLQAPRRPLSRGFLLQAIEAEDVLDRSIDVHVLRLRRKLDRGGTLERLIKTERGYGYIFDAAVERVY
jgi:two-component system, OmpR family, response regulator